MTKKEKEQREFAQQLTCSIALTFRKAYMMSLLGISEAQMLVDYDIQAAVSDSDPEIIETGRCTIKAAVRAVEERIPFRRAHEHLMQNVLERTDQIITAENSKKRKRSHA
jgi:hypothetical protein